MVVSVIMGQIRSLPNERRPSSREREKGRETVDVSVLMCLLRMKLASIRERIVCVRVCE